jgi:hypothetical protein
MLPLAVLQVGARIRRRCRSTPRLGDRPSGVQGLSDADEKNADALDGGLDRLGTVLMQKRHARMVLMRILKLLGTGVKK